MRRRWEKSKVRRLSVALDLLAEGYTADEVRRLLKLSANSRLAMELAKIEEFLDPILSVSPRMNDDAPSAPEVP
jgi:hypothetical protein